MPVNKIILIECDEMETKNVVSKEQALEHCKDLLDQISDSIFEISDCMLENRVVSSAENSVSLFRLPIFSVLIFFSRFM